MDDLLHRYRTLLETIDAWFAARQAELPEAIRCADGCSGCCRGLFDISLLDARLLRAGFDRLPADAQAAVRQRAQAQLAELQERWPGFAPPFILNLMDDAAWVEMPEDDPTPCAFLDEEGRCLVYAFRPMTCRLHGLPQIDLDGEIFLEEWCSRNFSGTNPLGIPALRADLRTLFAREFELLRAFSTRLCGLPSGELDTFIPLAALIDFAHFDWAGWAEQAYPALTRTR